jgi:hypothetical protein
MQTAINKAIPTLGMAINNISMNMGEKIHRNVLCCALRAMPEAEF